MNGKHLAGLTLVLAVVLSGCNSATSKPESTAKASAPADKNQAWCAQYPTSAVCKGR